MYILNSFFVYSQYDVGHSYTSVAPGTRVYGYAKGQYSTTLLGVGVQTHMTYGRD